MNYEEFLAGKRLSDVPTGFDPGTITPKAFDFQQDIIRWALRRGRAAILADCGLGKTLMEHAWADAVVRHTNKSVLLFAPLGVVQQHIREAHKFGFEVKYVRNQNEVAGAGIYITNYQKLHLFDLSQFVGVELDESSILKSFEGKFRSQIIKESRRVAYKLAGTATAAPNDLIEIINHAEFLGVMSGKEIIALFFKQDGNSTHHWKLKGHAEKDFWQWVCSWAVNIRKPSDLGYDDGQFILPKLTLVEHTIKNQKPMDGWLFPVQASTLAERRAARRASMVGRIDIAIELSKSNSDQWVFWCDLNDESTQLSKAIGAAEITGSTPEEEREEIMLNFLDGNIRDVVTKPALWGFGLNLQCCHQTACVGLSDSYERFYQLVRRFWRFGQPSPVDCHIITSEAEGAVLENIKRKEKDSNKLIDEMVKNMADISSSEIKGQTRNVMDYTPSTEVRMPAWL
jgi:hypothetical protein